MKAEAFVPRDEYETALLKVNELSVQNNSLSQEIVHLKQQLEFLKNHAFGSKSERFVDSNQTQILLGVDSLSVEEQTQQVSSHSRRKKVHKEDGHSRGPMPEHLPIVDEVIEPEQDIAGAEKIGEEVSWRYGLKPAILYIIRTIRPKYKTGTEIVIAEKPSLAIDKGNFDASFMSSVVADKFVYHLPLYRQIEKLKNEFGVQFAESTFCDIVKRSVEWYEPVYLALKEEILKSSYLQVDETPMPVIIKNKQGKTHKGFFWVYYDPVGKRCFFEYSHGRGQKNPSETLKDFKGIIQTDGYAGYNEVAKRDGINQVACMAHVRRKFFEAQKEDAENAEYALRIINKWFERERKILDEEGDLFENRKMMRRKHHTSEFEEFKKWMIEYCSNAIPSNLVRKACEYALNLWSSFDIYLENAAVELSNNLVENCIRPVAIGRKNYLFKGSEVGAKRSAIIYSLVATAKKNNMEPREYLHLLLDKLPSEKKANIKNYLPMQAVEA